MHGTGWQMGHNSRQYPFRPRGASIRPARIDFCFWRWSFSHFRCQNNKKYTPILREVLITHEYPDLRMSFNCLTGQSRDNKRALRTRYKVAIAARKLCFEQSRPTIAAVSHRNSTAWNWGSVRHSTISSQFSSYFVRRRAEKCVSGCTEEAHGVLSANFCFKKWKFCHFSHSYTKRSHSK